MNTLFTSSPSGREHALDFPAGFYAGGKADEAIATYRPNLVARREQEEAGMPEVKAIALGSGTLGLSLLCLSASG
jgi:hypothetical protein